MSFTYSPDYYNTKSANEVIPIILELLNPKSVVDVGCGIGTWLSVFKNKGVHDVLGIDGDHVDRSVLGQHIDAANFIARDLTKQLHVGRKFDLVMSLEVAEHIPEQFADTFIENLVSLGDYILFSAAIPFQGGDRHVNEQWPSYWQDKFTKRGFKVYDCLREKLWSNEKIEWWYKQNIFLAIRDNAEFEECESRNLLSLVHPEVYESKVKRLEEIRQELEDFQAGKISLLSLLKIFYKFITQKIFALNK